MEWRSPSQTCWDEWHHEESPHLSQGAIPFGGIWPAPSGRKASRWNNGGPLEEQDRKLLIRGVSCQDTFAPSYSAHATMEEGTVAVLAEERKVAKYVNLTPEHLFSPIAVETMGVLGPCTKALLRDLYKSPGDPDNRGGGSYHLPHSRGCQWQCSGATVPQWWAPQANLTLAFSID